MTQRYRVLILGAGLSSLTTAARLLELGETNIGICSTSTGGTPYIAGINFVVPDNPYHDNVENYKNDMIRAGYDINQRDLVDEMTRRNLEGYELLKRWGVEFAKKTDGSTKLRHLSGHSVPRTLCDTRELIGDQMLRKLTNGVKARGVTMHMDCECLKLLSDGERVYGATVKNPDGSIENIYGDAVVACWGGVGNLFGTSTYPADIQGNTLAIAHDAGAKLIDVEFLEYEPMVVMDPPGAIGEPCPTAMLGDGAHLLNAKGERFLLKVRPQGESGAPKTLINHQIWKEVDAGLGSPHGGVWVDLRGIDRGVLQTYPWFYNRLMNNGLDPKTQLVEVGPMAHSFSGGIAVDVGCRSSLKGFYAAGEAAGGFHGACRCAGNAASQTVMSGLMCAEAIAKDLKAEPVRCEYPIEYHTDKAVYDACVPKAKALAVKALGIYRRGTTLLDAQQKLAQMLDAPDICRDERARQIVESIALMVQAALERKESRGTHMRLDYPEASDEFKREMII